MTAAVTEDTARGARFLGGWMCDQQAATAARGVSV
jgi:hypothetical protein